VNIVQNGKTAQQNQRYLCLDCRRQFSRDSTSLGCSGARRALIVPLTMNSAGVRDIERVLLVRHYSVLKTLRAAAERVTEPRVPKRVRTLGLDECWSFVRSKKEQPWTR
jgi:transposase-like protein